MKAMLFGIAIVLASAPASSHEGEGKKVELKEQAAKLAPFLIGGAQAPMAHPATESTTEDDRALPVYRYIKYAEYSCDVDWQHHCEGSVVVQAPTGYQVCRALFSVTYQGGHDAWHAETPQEWYVNDPQSPDRFRAVEFKIHAFGSGNFFNQLGSRITLQEIGVSYISAEADNFQRYAAGCWMPPGG